MEVKTKEEKREREIKTKNDVCIGFLDGETVVDVEVKKSCRFRRDKNHHKGANRGGKTSKR